MSEVRLPAADWLTHADAITAAHSVETVRLTTLPDFPRDDPPMLGFEMAALNGRWSHIRFYLPEHVR